jgi:anti-sigma regulatory factor (Ser/Thr protein kinase)
VPYYRCPVCGLLSHSVASYSTAGVCANCSAPLPEDAKLEVVTETMPPVHRGIRAGLAAPAEARRAISGLPLGEVARQRLALVVSELVTNALRHAGLAAGDPIDLDVTSENGSVWISVHDPGPGFIMNGNTGTGFAIVDSVTDAWGVDRGPDGCTVWCAVDTAEGELDAPRRRRA